MHVTIDASIPAQLRAMVRLQLIDSKLDELIKLRGDLPETIRDLEDEKQGLETRVANLQEEAKEHALLDKKADSGIKDAEALIKRYTDQQLQVRNNREYDALTKEIEAQRLAIEEFKKTLELVKLAEEPRRLQVEEASMRLRSLDLDLAQKKKELSEVMAETQTEEENLNQLRDAAVAAVDVRYLNAYNRLRTRVRDGRAVIALVRGAAGGYSVPPQRQVDVRQRQRVIVCEHTGRIVVDEDIFHEVGREMNF